MLKEKDEMFTERGSKRERDERARKSEIWRIRVWEEVWLSSNGIIQRRLARLLAFPKRQMWLRNYLELLSVSVFSRLIRVVCLPGLIMMLATNDCFARKSGGSLHCRWKKLSEIIHGTIIVEDESVFFIEGLMCILI